MGKAALNKTVFNEAALDEVAFKPKRFISDAAFKPKWLSSEDALYETVFDETTLDEVAFKLNRFSSEAALNETVFDKAALV